MLGGGDGLGHMPIGCRMVRACSRPAPALCRSRRGGGPHGPAPPCQEGAAAVVPEQNFAATPLASTGRACSTTSGDTVTRQSPRHRSDTRRAFALSTLAVAAVLALSAGTAHAFDINTGNPDFAIRFDNTIRANYAVRVESRDPKIGNSVACRRGRLQLRQRRGGGQAHRPSVRIRPRLQEALWPAPERRGLVRRRLRRHEQVEPEAPLATIPSYINNQYSSTITQAVRKGRRTPRRVRLRRRRHRRRAGAGQARPAHDLLGRVAAARRAHAQRLVRAGAARPAEGLRHPGHRGQGAVPAA